MLRIAGRQQSGYVRELLEDRREGRAVLLSSPAESGLPYDEATLIPVSVIETMSILDMPAFGALRRDAVAVARAPSSRSVPVRYWRRW